MSLRAVRECGGEHVRRCADCKDESYDIHRHAVRIDEWAGAIETLLGEGARIAKDEETRADLLTAASGLLWAIGRLARDIQSYTLTPKSEAGAS